MDNLDFHSMRLGINSIISISNSLLYEKLVSLNIADNSLSDYGMHAIKNILDTTKLQYLNLASNMISGDGLETLTESICTHETLVVLDLGLLEGSMRKNSLGLHGASCLAAILIKNNSIQTLILNDNDIGKDGGDCIGIALS
jgi:Ran GTPase-activating protein (RanGAP) involved in mRNA processing and transport